ncbi:chemotaxis protein CheA, partial [Spirochaetota bacterium]
MRMVQIGDIFKRFERAARNLSRESGKEINLELRGGETEMDKNLIEKLVDPILHIIRNSIDHGIGKPEERIALGKPGTGKIELNAYQERGNVVIEIMDDGNGLNCEKILSKAVKMDLVKDEEAQNLTNNEIFQFIFFPGFSTSENVTEISGRGVGMDVVRKNIESLRGTVEIHSMEGKGTSMIIRLPLTLAIIDGFLVQVGDSKYILPLGMVSECIDLTFEENKGICSGNLLELRGEMIPILKLRDFFNESGEHSDREYLIIVENFNKKVGFIVDRTLGEYQTVIKPLNKLFGKIHWISGSTILGGGEVALILDVPKFINYIQSVEMKSAV